MRLGAIFHWAGEFTKGPGVIKHGKLEILYKWRFIAWGKSTTSSGLSIAMLNERRVNHFRKRTNHPPHETMIVPRSMVHCFKL